MDPIVGIVMGSDSDWPVMEPAAAALTEFGVPDEAHGVAAHRTPRGMRESAETAAGRGLRAAVERFQADLAESVVARDATLQERLASS